VTYGGLQLEPRWIAAHTERPPDRDAVQLAQMAQRAVPNVMRTIPDPELQAIRIEPGETESYAFQFRSASAPARMAQWSIRIMNGQEVSNFSGAGQSGRSAGGARANASPTGLPPPPASAGDVLDMSTLRIGPDGASKAAEAGWPGCETSVLLLHAVASDTPEWTVYCTLQDRRIAWGEVDNISGKLAPQPLSPALPPKPERLSEQPASGAPVDVGCLAGTAAPAASVPNTSQEEAEAGAARFRSQPTSTLFSPVPPQARLGELLSARPVSYTSSDGQRQNLQAWLLTYEWLPATPEDHAHRFYTLVGGQAGNAGYGSCFR
jgi:hypothetical protein